MGLEELYIVNVELKIRKKDNDTLEFLVVDCVCSGYTVLVRMVFVHTDVLP